MASATGVLILGDHQSGNAFKSYGFGSLLNQKFNGQADIILRKFAGYPTEWIKLVTGCACRNLNSNPDYVILVVGNDDCLHRKYGGLDNKNTGDLNFNQLKKNLYSIVNKLTNEVDVKFPNIIILSPFPIDEMKFESYEQNKNNFGGLQMQQKTITKLTKCYKEVAERFGARFIDTSLLLDANLDGNIKADGYRLSKEGHRLIYEELVELIKVEEDVFPTPDMVKDEDHLINLAIDSCLIPPDNIEAHTHLGTVEEYSAFFMKTYRGKV